jgi:enolase-phosphatase E1
VYDVLFPYARRALPGWLHAHEGTDALHAVTDVLAREHADDRRAGEAVPHWSETTEQDRVQSIEAYVTWLMARDRKATGLKLLQGLIWEEGYRSGQLRGAVYEDVPRALQRWKMAGIAAAIYSSGSELAQRRLFESTPHGDLTSLLSGFFDTRVGAKQSAESYAVVAARLGVDPRQMLFVSDVAAELSAADAAGCSGVLIVRPGNRPQQTVDRYPVVHSLDEIA